MSVVMKAKSTLTTLLMGDFALSNASFQKISQISQLTRLEINGAKIKSDGTASLANLSELKSLKIHSLIGFYDEDSSSDSSGSDSNDDDDMPFKLKESVYFFSRFKKLEEVEISNCDLNKRVVESLVVNNPNLRHLDVGGLSHRGTSSLTARSLKIIADNCPQLTHIGIVDHFELENEDILQLVSKCTKLKSANFENTRIEDSSLAKLAFDCPDLETLNLTECVEITKQGIESFLNVAGQGKLKRLDITYCDFINEMREDGINTEKLKEGYPHINIIF